MKRSEYCGKIKVYLTPYQAGKLLEEKYSNQIN